MSQEEAATCSMEGEREGLERRTMLAEERGDWWKRRCEKAKKELKERQEDMDWRRLSDYLEAKSKALERAEAELEELKASGRGRRGAAPEPEKEEEESEVIKVFKFFAEDRREITTRLCMLCWP